MRFLVMLLLLAGVTACEGAKMQSLKALAVVTGKECEHDCAVISKTYFEECDRVYVRGLELHAVCKAGTIEAHQKCVEECRSETR